MHLYRVFIEVKRHRFSMQGEVCYVPVRVDPISSKTCSYLIFLNYDKSIPLSWLISFSSLRPPIWRSWRTRALQMFFIETGTETGGNKANRIQKAQDIRLDWADGSQKRYKWIAEGGDRRIGAAIEVGEHVGEGEGRLVAKCIRLWSPSVDKSIQ